MALGRLIATMNIVWPGREHLAGYREALLRGWSPDTVRGKAAAEEQLALMAHDSDAFLAGLVDREARGRPICLLDGSTVARLPGVTRWLWDGEFCGSIGLRWQRGSEALPPLCLGHIGYAVVPWKQGRGYATRALGQLLPQAAAEGLRYVELITEPQNVASRRVIEANGGVLVEHFLKPQQHGGGPALRYRIALERAPQY
jgi:predicted acetyltransferase